jgi:hypothetical protein
MNNTQVATLVQTLLMVFGGAAVGSSIGAHTISATDATSIIGGIGSVLGIFWNHYAALQANKP